VLFYLFKFFNSQLAGGQEDRIGDADLSYIMQRSKKLNIAAELFREAELFSNTPRTPSDPDNMVSCLIISQLGNIGNGPEYFKADFQLLRLLLGKVNGKGNKAYEISFLVADCLNNSVYMNQRSVSPLVIKLAFPETLFRIKDVPPQP
jgi:hypothetical protein